MNSHWSVVRSVISSTVDGAQVMSAMPGLVRRLLDEDAWRDFSTPDGSVQHYDRFTEFVEASPPKGLGGRVGQLIALCGSDDELVRRVKALARNDIPEAGPHGSGPGRGKKRDRATVSFRAEASETAASTVSRLKRDDPEAAAQVVRQERSAYSVAQEKGWRKQRVYLANPETVARKIRESFTEEQIAQLIALLLPDGSDP